MSTKNVYRLLLPFLILLMPSLLFAAGGQETTDTEKSGTENSSWFVEETEEYIRIKDKSGRIVKLEKPVKTVIANGMGDVFATLRALGADDKLIASNEYVRRNAAFFPRIAKLPSFCTTEQVNSERVFSMDPDLILSKPFFDSQYSDAVRESYPIVNINVESPEDIRMLGALVGKKEEAEAYIAWIESYTSMIQEQISKLREDQLKELFIYYGGEYGMAPPPPYGSFGRDNSRNALVRQAGGISISEAIPGDWVSIDPEWLVEQNPALIIREIYLTGDYLMGYRGKGPAVLEEKVSEISDRPAFSGSGAVHDGAVYCFYGDLFEDAWFLGLGYLAKLLHPDLFQDFNPQQMHQEYIDRFQGIDYDVAEQGLFLYPEVKNE